MEHFATDFTPHPSFQYQGDPAGERATGRDPPRLGASRSQGFNECTIVIPPPPLFQPPHPFTSPPPSSLHESKIVQLCETNIQRAFRKLVCCVPRLKCAHFAPPPPLLFQRGRVQHCGPFLSGSSEMPFPTVGSSGQYGPGSMRPECAQCEITPFALPPLPFGMGIGRGRKACAPIQCRAPPHLPKRAAV